MTESAGAQRLTSLDGLRGFAAVMVVIHHAVFMSPDYASSTSNFLAAGFWSNPISWFKGTPLRLLISGQSAVLIFFVLSGFVLALTLEKVERWQYRPYVIKRVARIYLPFAAATMMACGLWLWFQPTPQPSVSDWFNGEWPAHQLTWLGALSHFAMDGREIWLNNPMWSLIQEMRISLVFPLIALAVRSRPRTALTAFGLLWIATIFTDPFMREPMLNSWLITARTLFFFAIGAALFFNLDRVRVVVANAGWLIRLSAYGLFAVLLMAPADLKFSPLALVGAAGIVTLAATDRAAHTVLGNAFFGWLGRISYSLYLLHVIVFNVVVTLLGSALGYSALVAIAVPSSFLAAMLMNAAIERPAMRLGRRLANA